MMAIETREREAADDQGQAPGSKSEALKLASDGLAGTLVREVNDFATEGISAEAAQLLKFHGSYQQDDRDQRAVRRREKRERAWQFMVRTKFPGGRLTAEQYLRADDLATTHAGGGLRITSRQDFQFHGVGKRQLKGLIRALNEGWMTTYGGCGDIARNTLTCPVADVLGLDVDLQALARRVSDHFLADSTAYYELWLDGERFLADGRRVRVTPRRDEHFYGPAYMPRKHKIGIALPGDNCIDVFTNDLGLETVLDAGGRLRGFNLLAGGGLGSTHGQAATFPRLGDRIGFTEPEAVMTVLEAATALYRDYGDRQNRRHARLKYVLADRGVEWFREELGRRLGAPLLPPLPLPPYALDDHLGWRRQADGRWLVGVYIENGRIVDTPARALKSGLRALIDTFRPEIRLTPQQNLILVNIPEEAKARLQAQLGQLGLAPEATSALRRATMACPALPTCGLAVAEAERALPSVIAALEQRGFSAESVTIRMSGCPNACSRPPTAEIGLVGRSLGLYSVYLGGSQEGTRLSRLYRDDVRLSDLPDLLAGLLRRWRGEREAGERFGDWSARVLVPA